MVGIRQSKLVQHLARWIDMTKSVFKVPSSDGIHTLAGVVYFPEGDPRGFFHIVHGMTEHIGRYDKFMTEMTNAGYICFGYDNLGHGHTVNNESELGYISKKNGHDMLARDVKVYSDAVISKYSNGKDLPYYLMGHSMGSFITRFAIQKYVRPDKYIIMGTGGKNPAAGAGLAVIAIIRSFYGDRHISKLVDKLAFGSYNERFNGGTPQDPSPWLTNDEDVRKKYYSDKYCTFKFTVSAMGDLIRLNKLTNSNEWYNNIPHDLEILLVSGENDPVGNNGKGVIEVCDKLKKQGIDARCIIYSDARHEILNDFTYEQTKEDILQFLNR